MKRLEVVGAILVKNEKILCAQRGETKTLAHLWEFPGGKIEAGETARQALVRELIEELSIEVEVAPTAFLSNKYEYDFAKIQLSTFVCHLKEGTPKLSEHLEVKWLPISKLDQLKWAPADIPTVDKLMSQGL